MYGNKSENEAPPPGLENKRGQAVEQESLRARAVGEAAPIIPARRPVIRPEVVRRSVEYPATGSEAERPVNSYSDGKKLIVGRDIALSGSINACEKLIVEGRVEANISDCQEIEVTETGTFKGEAEIDVAEISGVFEGSLIARELLMIRNSGRVSGSIRFGQLEVERGGRIEGDIGVFHSDEETGGESA